MSSVPGRKTLVMLTSGFPLNPEFQSELTAVVDTCNKSNVAIYPIDVRGLVVPSLPGTHGRLELPSVRPASGSLIPAALRYPSTQSPVSFLRMAAFAEPLSLLPPQHVGGGGGGGGGGHGGTGGGGTGGGGTGGTGSGGGTAVAGERSELEAVTEEILVAERLAGPVALYPIRTGTTTPTPSPGRLFLSFQQARVTISRFYTNLPMEREDLSSSIPTTCWAALTGSPKTKISTTFLVTSLGLQKKEAATP